MRIRAIPTQGRKAVAPRFADVRSTFTAWDEHAHCAIMLFTNTFDQSAYFSANSTDPRLPSTFPALLKPISSFVSSTRADRFAACGAWDLVFSRPVLLPVIVNRAQAKSEMRTWTQAAFSIELWPAVHFRVLGVTWEKLKVFESIISPLVISVVHNLIRIKEASQMFLHDQTMLSNIVVRCFVRMIRGFYKHITLPDYLGDSAHRLVMEPCL